MVSMLACWTAAWVQFPPWHSTPVAVTQPFSNEHKQLNALWLPSRPLQGSGSRDSATLVWAGYAITSGLAAIYLYSIVKGFFKLLPVKGLNFLFQFLYTFPLTPFLMLKLTTMMRYFHTALLLVWTKFVLLRKAFFSSNQFKRRMRSSLGGWDLA